MYELYCVRGVRVSCTVRRVFILAVWIVCRVCVSGVLCARYVNELYCVQGVCMSCVVYRRVCELYFV